jgi:hypothetical protein
LGIRSITSGQTLPGNIFDNNIVGFTTPYQLDGGHTTALRYQDAQGLKVYREIVGDSSKLSTYDLDTQNVIINPTGIGTSVGGESPISSEGGYSEGTMIYNRKHLLRTSTSAAWQGSRIHDAIEFDNTNNTPRTDTRAWYERDPDDGSHHWGDMATELMVLNKYGILTFPSNVGNNGKILLRSSSGGSNYSYLNYNTDPTNSIITLMPDSYYSVGTKSLVGSTLYPCYDIANPVTIQFATATNNQTIPYALDTITITGYLNSNVLRVGEYVLLTVGASGVWNTYLTGNSYPKMMWGIVTNVDNTTPGFTVDILYYRSGGATNFITAGNQFYIAAAFPFLLKQPSTIHSTVSENCSLSNGGYWKCSEIGVYFNTILIAGCLSPLTTLLDSRTPSTES